MEGAGYIDGARKVRKGPWMVLCSLIGSSGFHLHRSLRLRRHRVSWCGWLRPKGDIVLCALCACVSAFFFLLSDSTEGLRGGYSTRMCMQTHDFPLPPTAMKKSVRTGGKQNKWRQEGGRGGGPSAICWLLY